MDIIENGLQARPHAGPGQLGGNYASFPRVDPASLIPTARDAIRSRWEHYYASRRWLIRRCVEALLAAMALVLLSPLLLLIALMIAVDSRGKVVVAQERLGWKGKPFTMYKFRSMQPGENDRHGFHWSTVNDPRCTRVGRLLRRAHMDELLQLVNVVKGDMSFIGFRPLRREAHDLLVQHIPNYELRHVAKPGLTGWAQVSHGYGGTIEGHEMKFSYELHYLANGSPKLDWMILARTLREVVRLEGV